MFILKKSTNKGCIKSKAKKITICGHIYKFYYRNKNKNSYYYCSKRRSGKCKGQVILSPNGTIVKQSSHSCKLPGNCNTLNVRFKY